MTVAATTNRKTYTGDNVTTSFATSPVIFYLSSNLQVRVTVIATGVSTLLTENTHYTVSGGGAAGLVGTVSLAGGSSPHGALLSTEKLVILRVLPLTQASDLVNNNNSDAEVLEAALDKLTDVDQQLSERQDRALTFPEGDVSGSTTTLQDASVRAGRLLGFDTLGVLTTFVLQVGTSLVDLAAAGASLIGFIQAGTGAVLRTLQAKSRDTVSVLDFAANGVSGAAVDPTGVLNSLLGVQAAINTGKSVYLPDGTYFLGTFNTAASEVSVLSITGKSNVKYFGPGILKVTSANTCVPKIIELDNSHDIDLDLSFTDSGYDESLTYQGAICVNVLGTTGPVFNIRAKLNSNGCVGTLVTGNVNATVPANAIYNIELDLNCKNSLYGTLFRNAGDHVHGVVKTENAHRSYFSYGAQHHKIDVFSKNHSNVNPAQDVIIKTYDGRDAQDIEINYKCQGFVSATPPVEIENQTTTGKAVKDITVTVNDMDSTNTNTSSVYICTRDVNGLVEATSSKIVNNIKIGGHTRFVPHLGTQITGGVINYIEPFGVTARKMASPNQIAVGAAFVGNPGYVGNVGWRLRMPDGMTWIVYRGNDNSAIFDIPLTAADSMGVMKVEVHVYDGYQATAIWRHQLDYVVWTKAAGVATLQSRVVEIATSTGAVGTVNIAANAGNMRYTFAGWTAAANGLIILRYEDQQSDAATAD